MNKESQVQRRLLYNVLFVFFVGGAAAQPLGSLIPILRESYKFRYSLSGIMLSCQSAGNLISILLAGILPTLLGRRRSILLTAVWMTVAYGLLTAGLGAPALLMAACLMMGIARGGTSNFCNTMVSTLPQTHATRNFNLLHGCYSIGALLSPLLLLACTRLLPGSGWRIATAVLLALCFVQLLVYSTMPLPPESGSKSIQSIDRSFLKVRAFWLSTAMLLLYISAEYAIVGWLVTYFQDTGLLSPAHSQLMNSLLWLAIFAGRILGSVISLRVSKRLLLLVDGLGMPVFLTLMLFARSAGAIILCLVGVGLFMATLYPTAIAYGSHAISGNDLGCSIMIFLASTGGVITPALVGFLAQRMGITAGMWLIAFVTIALLAVIVTSILTDKKKI